MSNNSYAALFIVQQPLPMVITKGKPLEEPVCVKLLTGANMNIQSVSPVKAILNLDNPQVKNAMGPGKAIENDMGTLLLLQFRST
jgi:hypothetical protein